MNPTQGRIAIPVTMTGCGPKAYLSGDEEQALKRIRHLYLSAEGIKQRLRSLPDLPETRVEREELSRELETLRAARDDWNRRFGAANHAKHLGLGHAAS